MWENCAVTIRRRPCLSCWWNMAFIRRSVSRLQPSITWRRVVCNRDNNNSEEPQTSTWRRRQQVPPKYWFPSTTQHDITSNKTVILITGVHYAIQQTLTANHKWRNYTYAKKKPEIKRTVKLLYSHLPYSKAGISWRTDTTKLPRKRNAGYLQAEKRFHDAICGKKCSEVL
jgi:hypothetical protein